MRLTLTLILCATPTISVGQTQCGGVADVLAGLAANYGETVRVSALMTTGQVMVITAAPGGSWTALGVTADGQACILAEGEAFEVQEAEPPGDDS